MKIYLRHYAPLYTVLLSLVCASFAFGQTPVSAPRKFKTTSKTTMYAEPDFHSKKIGEIPSNTILLSLSETAPYGGYIQVQYKNKTGWVFKVETERYMDVPAPEIVFWSDGYKIIGNTYRYFFVIRNDGTMPYDGKITLRLFGKNNTNIYERTVDFSPTPMPKQFARVLIVDTVVESLQFELEHREGKIKGGTDKFIERLPE